MNRARRFVTLFALRTRGLRTRGVGAGLEMRALTVRLLAWFARVTLATVFRATVFRAAWGLFRLLMPGLRGVSALVRLFCVRGGTAVRTVRLSRLGFLGLGRGRTADGFAYFSEQLPQHDEILET